MTDDPASVCPAEGACAAHRPLDFGDREVRRPGGVSNVCLVVKSARRVAAVEPDRRVSIKASSVASGVFTAAAVCAFYLA